MKFPSFCDEEGYMISEISIESVFHPTLEEIQDHRERSLVDSIISGPEVKEHYRCNLSFRRRAENQALGNGLDNSVIKFVHRWSEFEGSKGKHPGFNMFEQHTAGANICYLHMRFVNIL